MPPKRKGRTPPPAGPRPSERRIQACVKACEEFTTEMLEAGQLTAVLDRLPELQAVLGTLYMSAHEVRETPDGVAQLRTALGHLYRAVGGMCERTGRPSAGALPDTGAQPAGGKEYGRAISS